MSCCRRVLHYDNHAQGDALAAESCSYLLLIIRNPLQAFSSIAAGWLQESNSNHLHGTPAAQPRRWMLLPLIAHVIHACYITNIMRACMQPCTLVWLAVSIVAETARNGQHVLPAQNELRSTDDVARLLGSKAVTNGAHVVLLVGAWVSQHVAQQANQPSASCQSLCSISDTTCVSSLLGCATFTGGNPRPAAATRRAAAIDGYPAVPSHATCVLCSDGQCMLATLLSMYSNDIHG